MDSLISDIKELKEELVKKVDEDAAIRRLRYQFMDDEYENCFRTMSRKEFVGTFNTPPEEGFIDSCLWVMQIDKDRVKQVLVSLLGEDYIKDVFEKDNRKTEEIVERIEDIIEKIEQKEDLCKIL